MKNGVVIVTYNRIELLKECIACVQAQTIPFFRVVIVNNCSTDGTKEYLEELQTKDENGQFVILHEDENLGGAGGFYHGLKIAKDLSLDWLLIIDDDAMIAPDYMEHLLDAKGQGVTQNENEMPVALAGSVWTDGKIDYSHRRRITNTLLFVESLVDEKEYQQEGGFFCDCATFCGLVLRGDVLEKIGLPKKEYFIWYDDSEYCLRLRKYGGILVLPEAKLYHKTKLPEETAGLLERTSWRHYYGYRNRYDTARIHFGKLTATFVAMEYIALFLLSCTMLLSKEKREKGSFNIRMIKDALYDGKHKLFGKNEKYHP